MNLDELEKECCDHCSIPSVLYFDSDGWGFCAKCWKLYHNYRKPSPRSLKNHE